MPRRNKRRKQLSVEQNTSSSSQSTPKPVIPTIRIRSDPSNILQCRDDEFPGLVQAWTEYASGLVKTRETCEEIQPKQGKIVEYMLQRLLAARYPGAGVPLKPK